ncbi:Crp/Fnr family transcriptional regulator [Pseudohaliea sp.]|uniref:Crp/Fnr family transcriptional regulator n=1 Tax=Pseudohaliea sp. TaxID=2740289 RepID=UPI0032ED1E2F
MQRSRWKDSEVASVLLQHGWLAGEPELQAEVMARGRAEDFAAGEVVFRVGDSCGGIYGLVDGVLGVSTAPRDRGARLVQFGIVGAWAGEGCFISGERRRSELRAISDCTLFHLPLDAMRQIVAGDPEALRGFARITIAHYDVMARIIDDLLLRNVECRIAAVLERASWLFAEDVPVSQAELGAMSNASRSQVNAALARFESRGWVSYAYRSIRVLDPAALWQFAHPEEADDSGVG